jgi:peptidoglycan/LPS O-acetylase OafA/YrhL
MGWLKELEGLRGIASLWVLALHVSILSGTHFPIISQGALGVDLFILLSGFLMVHNYEQRKLVQPWSAPKTIRTFWLRRFFRIAPLYYLLLLLALAMSPILSWARLVIAEVYPLSATDPLRYTDHSWLNIVTHLGFVFGVLPEYSFRTALPDWSIGLEMQFYLVFPLLMLIVLRFGYVAMTGSIVAVSVGAYFLAKHFFTSFPMPSFLPLKIHMFLLGMIIAAAYHRKLRWPLVFAVVLPLYAFVVPSQSSRGWVAADMCLGIGLTLLVMNYSQLRTAVDYPRKFLSLPVCQKLGDVSYSLYLVHLLLVLPVCASLLRVPGVTSMPDVVRFALCFAASAMVVLPVSMLLYHYVEKPGIAAGKALLSTRKVATVAVPSD